MIIIKTDHCGTLDGRGSIFKAHCYSDDKHLPNKLAQCGKYFMCELSVCHCEALEKHQICSWSGQCRFCTKLCMSVSDAGHWSGKLDQQTHFARDAKHVVGCCRRAAEANHLNHDYFQNSLKKDRAEKPAWRTPAWRIRSPSRSPLSFFACTSHTIWHQPHHHEANRLRDHLQRTHAQNRVAGYQFGNRFFITAALVKTLKLSPLICNIVFAEDEKGWLHSLRRPILRDLTRIHYVYCSLKEEQNQIPRCRGVL